MISFKKRRVVVLPGLATMLWSLDLLYLLVSDVLRRPSRAPCSCHDISSLDLNLDLPGPCLGNTPLQETVFSMYLCILIYLCPE